MSIQAPQFDEHANSRGSSMVVPHQTGREPRPAFVPSPRDDHIPRGQEEFLPISDDVSVKENSRYHQAGYGQSPGRWHPSKIARIEGYANPRNRVSRQVHDAVKQLLGDRNELPFIRAQGHEAELLQFAQNRIRRGLAGFVGEVGGEWAGAGM